MLRSRALRIESSLERSPISEAVDVELGSAFLWVPHINHARGSLADSVVDALASIPMGGTDDTNPEHECLEDERDRGFPFKVRMGCRLFVLRFVRERKQEVESGERLSSHSLV